MKVWRFLFLKKNKIIDIGADVQGEACIITEPGVILGELKQAVRSEGYLYPPDPTSYKEVQVGATVATNATGEETFKYGPTRRYVQELEVILPDGSLKILTRKEEVPHSVIKNTAGYYLRGEEIDEVIGSEGTLCLIKKIKMKLLKVQKDKTFVLVLPFSKFDKCLQAVPYLAGSDRRATPKAIELIGPGAADCFKKCSACPAELKDEKCFLYIKDEYSDEADFNESIEVWFDWLKKIYEDVGEVDGLDRIFLAKTDKQLSDIHECRHYIPSLINEKYFDFSGEGGGKVGTDWWVPLKHLQEMMMTTYREAQGLTMPFIVFAHVGNGHPHWNFLARNAQEKKIAIDFVKRQCQAAVKFGGGVAGEHGIGKIKRYYMPIQHSAAVLKEMVAVKERWDPLWIFGRGNILEYKI